MSFSSNTLASGVTWEIWEAGRFFRILNATGAVNVEFYKNGGLVSQINNVYAGFWRESREETDFDRVRVVNVSGGSNVVEVMIDAERIGYDRMSISGVIEAKAKAGAVTHTAATVTTAAATAAVQNLNRSFLFIQNRSATGNIFVRFGAAATTGTGIKLTPGAAYESGTFVPSNYVSMIGDIASNPDVLIVEG